MEAVADPGGHARGIAQVVDEIIAPVVQDRLADGRSGVTHGRERRREAVAQKRLGLLDPLPHQVLARPTLAPDRRNLRRNIHRPHSGPVAHPKLPTRRQPDHSVRRILAHALHSLRAQRIHRRIQPVRAPLALLLDAPLHRKRRLCVCVLLVFG